MTAEPGATRTIAAPEDAPRLDTLVASTLQLSRNQAATLIAEGRVTVNATANPGPASAGSGDVLAGAIGALLAQGLEPYDAARLGACVHGLAGDEAAAVQGTLGMTAGDVIEELPRALHRLALKRDETRDARPRP